MTRSMLLAALAVALFPATALAGSCPVCTTSADCTASPGEEAFCVLHDRDVGCGAERQICCPGQGCNTFSGRPSCEGTTCVVVDGATDAGTPGTDSGPSPADAGGTPVDGGGAAIDSGTSGTDAGRGTTSGGGCGCRAADGGSPLAALALVTLIATALVVRRR